MFAQLGDKAGHSRSATIGTPSTAHTGAAAPGSGQRMPGNLLITDGRLTGVPDFPTAGKADPATDLIVAWNLLPASIRPAFRDAVTVDDATWARGRAKALSIAVIALPYYLTTNPHMTDNAHHTIDAVLTDHQQHGSID